MVLLQLTLEFVNDLLILFWTYQFQIDFFLELAVHLDQGHVHLLLLIRDDMVEYLLEIAVNTADESVIEVLLADGLFRVG